MSRSKFEISQHYCASILLDDTSESYVEKFDLKTVKPLMVFECYECTSSKRSEIFTDQQSTEVQFLIYEIQLIK